MVRLLRFAAVVALGGIATAGLSACAGAGAEGEVVSPSVSVVASPPPSVTPSPSVTPEEELLARIPENARIESFPSAVEFSIFFIELYAPLYESDHESELFEYLCTEEATFCASSLEGSRASEAAGAHSEGGEFTWSSELARGGLQSDNFWYVEVPFAVTDTITYLADGTQNNISRGGAGVVTLKLNYDHEAGVWRVHGVNFQYDDE
jgi:hypothetical protein